MDNDNFHKNLSEFDSLHEVIHAVLRRANVKEIAKKLGRSLFSVLHWGDDPEVSHRPIPSETIVPLCIAAKDNRPIAFMAKQVGGVFVEIGNSYDNISVVSVEMSKVSKEYSEVVGEYAEATKDGKVTNREIKCLMDETLDLIRSSIRFYHCLGGNLEEI